jgi:hypothetical protein
MTTHIVRWSAFLISIFFNLEASACGDQRPVKDAPDINAPYRNSVYLGTWETALTERAQKLPNDKTASSVQDGKLVKQPQALE